MNIFLAGATGAVGRSLIPLLTDHGHTVTGTTRSPEKADSLRALGAEPVVVDALDQRAVLDAVAAAQPDAIVSQLTSLSGLDDLRKFEQAFALTNRLRTEGTEHLLAAARATGVERVIVQSYAGWTYARTGGPVKAENDPFDPHPPKQMRTTLDAIRRQEEITTAAGGVALRYGGFYGPGTGLAPGGEQWEAVRRASSRSSATAAASGRSSTSRTRRPRRWPRSSTGRRARSTTSSTTSPRSVRDWLPGLAAAIGAPPPRKVPRWVARLMGEHLVSLMCEVRGASNAKARSELDWAPRWPTWREGFAALGATRAPARAA